MWQRKIDNTQQRQAQQEQQYIDATIQHNLNQLLTFNKTRKNVKNNGLNTHDVIIENNIL